MTSIGMKREPGKFPLLDLFDEALREQFGKEASELYVGAEWCVTGNGVPHEDADTAGMFFRTPTFNRMCVYAFVKMHADELFQQYMLAAAENLKAYPEDADA